MNDKYSYGDFMQRKFADLPAEEFAGEIVGSCFYQEGQPDQEVFPAGTVCTFVRCNLDNVAMPPGCTVRESSQRRIVVQNDGEDWEVNESRRPTRPVNPKHFIKEGKSLDPRDIPSTTERVRG